MRLALLGFALLLAALPAGAQETRSRSALTRLVESLVPGLTVDGLRGPLASRPGFDRLTIADDQGIWLEIEGASIDWAATALVRRRLHIRELTAARLTIRRPPAAAPAAGPPAQVGPTPLIPELPSLPVALRIDRFQLERIEMQQPVLGEPVALSASGSARLDPEGLNLALDAALIEGGTVLSLQAALRPDSGQLSAAATLRSEAGGPLSRLAGLGERPLALDLSLDGPPEGARFTLAASAGDGLGADLAGTVAAPDTARLALTMQGQVTGAGLVEDRLAPLAGPVEVALDTARQPDGRFALRSLRLAGAAGTIQASGLLDPAGAGNELALQASLPSSETLAPLLPDAPAGWEAVAVEATITGALAAPQLAATVAPAGFRSEIEAAAALLGPSPRLELRAVAPDRIEALTLTSQAIRAEASGQVGETLDLAFRTDIAASQEAVPGLAGALSLQGTATGPAADPTLTLTARSDRLEAAGRVLEALDLSARIAAPASSPQVTADATGTLEGLPLTLAVRGAPGEGGWLVLEQAEAGFGPARLSATGRLHPTELLADGQARLDVPELEPFAALLGQPIAGTIRIEARGTPVEGRQTLAAQVEVPRLAAAGVTARAVTASAEGSLAALDIALAGQVNQVEAEARGRLSEGEAGARVLDLAALRAQAFDETIRLVAPTRITLRPDGGVALAGATIALPRSGTLRAEGVWGPERADIRATLVRLDLAAFAAFAPEVEPAGIVSGEARVTGPVAAPELIATLRGSGLASGAAPGLPPGELRLDLRRAAEGLVTAEAQASLGPQNRLTAAARFPQGPAAAAPFEGRLDGTLDIGALSSSFLAAGADRISGRMTLALRATGTPAAPVLDGEARVSGGSYRNAPLGVAISDIAGVLRPDGPLLRADITGRTSGEGRLALAGTIAPFEQYLPLDLVLTANGATPVASDLLRATLDAELRLAGLLGQGATLSGPVRVRRAEIRVPERLGGRVRSLGDVTEIGTPPGRAPRRRPPPRANGEEVPGPPIALAITVEAPRNVFVRGRGLDAELGGQLAIGGRLADPEITGALDLIRGDLAVVGRRLAFDRGRLTWTGALLPDLALRASSRAGGTTVAVEVTGPPTQPELVFTSTPELPQDEVLARLLFDRPLRDLSPLEIAQIGAAAAGATGALGGGEGFLGRLRQGLGLDRLAVGGGMERAGSETTAEQRSNTTVEAGRYVADGVYVGVRQGTEPGSSRVGVRVDLTPRLKLEAETGDREAGNRVGLSYEWEWGR
ncbi:MAG TPA: translocation/assembly module TamB domain-containing protein [Falsiroseomonas sp.]|jgi:translocation and assembly module TamB|nr:translocation/assembly module TamB domain-containing protein [Falsiroseomonas sp.]